MARNKSEGNRGGRAGANEGGDGIDIDSAPKPLQGPMRFVRSRRGNFYMAMGLLGVGFLANALASDAYERYKPWKETDDEFIARIVAAQKSEFASVHSDLKAIRGALPREGREAFDSLKETLVGLEMQSAGLVQQLDLANQEIARMAAVAESRGGVGAGYDFTLADSSSMDLAPGAVVGVTNIDKHGVRVNLTSEGQNAVTGRFISSGESLSYVGAGGRNCSVALMSVRPGEPGAASFKTNCLAGN